MSTARYRPVCDILDGWRDDVLSGNPPTHYPVGVGELGRIEIGPGLVTLIGGGTRGREDGHWLCNGCSTPWR